MKACTSPRLSWPAATRRPPTTATSTYDRFPTKNITGMMIPLMNCAPNAALYSSAFLSWNVLFMTCWRPNTLTSA